MVCRKVKKRSNCLSVCPSILPSIHPSHLSIYLSSYGSILSIISIYLATIHLSVSLFHYLSIYLYVYLSIYLAISLSLYLSIHHIPLSYQWLLSIYLYIDIYLSIYLAISLSLSLLPMTPDRLCTWVEKSIAVRLSRSCLTSFRMCIFLYHSSETKKSFFFAIIRKIIEFQTWRRHFNLKF